MIEFKFNSPDEDRYCSRHLLYGTITFDIDIGTCAQSDIKIYYYYKQKINLKKKIIFKDVEHDNIGIKCHQLL